MYLLRGLDLHSRWVHHLKFQLRWSVDLQVGKIKHVCAASKLLLKNLSYCFFVHSSPPQEPSHLEVFPWIALDLDSFHLFPSLFYLFPEFFLSSAWWYPPWFLKFFQKLFIYPWWIFSERMPIKSQPSFWSLSPDLLFLHIYLYLMVVCSILGP